MTSGLLEEPPCDPEAGSRQQTSAEQSTRHDEGEASLVSVGQRHINLLWEGTQRQIAVGVMYAFLAIVLVGAVSQLLRRVEVEVPPSLAGVVGYVIGNYFARTNHEKIGGVAKNATSR